MWLVHQEHMTVLNMYASNIGTPKYVKQILTKIKGERNSNTGRVGDFSILFSTLDKTSKQRINKETVDLNNAVGQID